MIEKLLRCLRKGKAMRFGIKYSTDPLGGASWEHNILDFQERGERLCSFWFRIIFFEEEKGSAEATPWK